MTKGAKSPSLKSIAPMAPRGMCWHLEGTGTRRTGPNLTVMWKCTGLEGTKGTGVLTTGKILQFDRFLFRLLLLNLERNYSRTDLLATAPNYFSTIVQKTYIS
jgi:hypothetical protein